MTKRMLIDTTHAEETRVVVLDGNRLEDYDVETATKKQIKGNIYLAKIVRIEPSLQAAFVEYGGNRHGFLAFSEIHPDYYQIPVADRERLLALQEEEARAEEARADREELAQQQNGGDDDDAHGADTDGDTAAAHRIEAGADAAEAVEHGEHPADAPASDGDHPDEINLDIETDEVVAEPGGPGESAAGPDGSEAVAPEQVGGESHADDSQAQRRTARFLRQYKIQEVMRRRQILLVQVVKEERGNKGAALTTYISLAGRFSVLMPNSPRGGGVSRKITAAADRRRLKEITAELDLPRGMGMIVRTAGAQRPRAEILRDGEYLLRTWDDIRETTLASVAPCLVYEEASLIKRAIRDLYSRDIEEIVVDGEPGWRGAREFMRQLMPGNHGRVNLWRGGSQNGSQSLFGHHNVEQHLDAMLQPTVQLRSGGYLVINQTEALVAIDVNSGRATRERSVEETALRTNLEAADEVARQLRLRDLAGLIVIDFIDMESRRNNASVERRLKDALRNDRARIQVGSISAFGLMEMSRQRLRPSLAESSFVTCPHCNGSGFMRGTESSALHLLRAIEEEAAKRRAGEVLVHAATPVTLYVLNHKREWLREIETRHHLVVNLAVDDALVPPAFRIEKVKPYAAPAEATAEPVQSTTEARRIPIETVSSEAETAEEREDAPITAERDGGETDEAGRRRRRRRRRGGRRDNGAENGSENVVAAENADDEGESDGQPGEGADQPAPTLQPGDTLDTPSVFDGETVAAPVVAETTEAVDGAGDGSSDGAERRGRRRRGGRNRNRNRFEDGREDGRTETGQDTGSVAAPAPQRAYSGPTPADPFAGSFDIFAMMDHEEEPALLPDPSASAASHAAPDTGSASTPALAEPLGTTRDDPDAMPAAKLPPAPLAQTAAAVTGEPAELPAELLGETVAEPGSLPAEAEAVSATAAEPEGEVAPAKPARATRARKPRQPKAEAEAAAKPAKEKATKEPRAPRTRRTKAAAATTDDAAAPAQADTVAEAVAVPAAMEAAAPGATPAAVPDAAADKAADPSIVQPTVIGDAPAPARRTGWWKR